MKKSYESPELIIHGNVETITQAFGESSAEDTIEYNGRSFPGDGGSQDGVVVPK